MQVLKRLISRGVAAHMAPIAMMGLVALAGCQSDPDEKAPQCPVFLTRPDASSVTRYDGRGHDLTNLVLSATLKDTPGACKGQLGHKVITAHAHAEFLMTRGPASQSRDVALQYNVAILKDGRLLEEKPYIQHVTFPPNVDSVQVTGDEINFSFPTQRGLSGPSYKVYFVLELTPEELAVNQKALINK